MRRTSDCRVQGTKRSNGALRYRQVCRLQIGVQAKMRFRSPEGRQLENGWLPDASSGRLSATYS
jgi:hypothetical protein